MLSQIIQLNSIKSGSWFQVPNKEEPNLKKKKSIVFSLYFLTNQIAAQVKEKVSNSKKCINPLKKYLLVKYMQGQKLLNQSKSAKFREVILLEGYSFTPLLGFESDVFFLWEYLFLLLWELWGFERCGEDV